jgi:multidrug efflux pump
MKDIRKEFGPSSWAIDNKTAVYVLIFLISVLGLISYNNLPKENFPDIAQSKVFVTTVYAGQSPENIENLVTRQIEKQLKSLKGLKKVTSNSVQNVSIITAEFQANIKIKDAKIDVTLKSLRSQILTLPIYLSFILTYLAIMILKD